MIQFIFITIVRTQIALQWELYNLDGSRSADSNIMVGYYGKELRLKPNGNTFQSTLNLASKFPMYPQYPVALMNSAQLSVRVAATKSGQLIFTSLHYNPQYEQPPSYEFNALNTVCTIIPQTDFDSIMFGGKVSIVLDFNNCIPIDSLSVKISYNSITKTLNLKNELSLSFDVSAVGIPIGGSITVSFVASQYYSINSVTLPIIASSQAIPVGTITQSYTKCLDSSNAAFEIKCDKQSIAYYAYYYETEPTFATIKAAIGTVKKSIYSEYEGMGFIKLEANQIRSVSIAGLKSNSNYGVVAYCEDQWYQTSVAVRTQIQTCDNNLKITKILLNTVDLSIREAVCRVMLQYQLKSSQVSTDTGIYCDRISQYQYSTVVISDTPRSIFMLIYPDWTLSVVPTYSSMLSTQITTISTVQYQPTQPQVLQEYISVVQQQTNFTISINQDGFIYIGLDAINNAMPTFRQLVQGVNGLNSPLYYVNNTKLIMKQQQTFHISVSDNIDYQLYYVIASDPSLQALHGGVQTRKFSLVKQSSYSRTYKLWLLIILILYI